MACMSLPAISAMLSQFCRIYAPFDEFLQKHCYSSSIVIVVVKKCLVLAIDDFVYPISVLRFDVTFVHLCS